MTPISVGVWIHPISVGWEWGECPLQILPYNWDLGQIFYTSAQQTNTALKKVQQTHEIYFVISLGRVSWLLHVSYSSPNDGSDTTFVRQNMTNLTPLSALTWGQIWLKYSNLKLNILRWGISPSPDRNRVNTAKTYPTSWRGGDIMSSHLHAQPRNVAENKNNNFSN